MTPVLMSDWKLFVIVAAIGVGVFYLRNYVRKKAENLARKEDLKDLTDIVERVRAQFERANLVHRVQFEAEFRVCQDLWRDANKALSDVRHEFGPGGTESDYIPKRTTGLLGHARWIQTVRERRGLAGVLRVRKFNIPMERR